MPYVIAADARDRPRWPHPSVAREGPRLPTLAADLQRLRRAVSGELILPADSAFAAARRVWNGAIDRFPAAILRCASPDDVRRGIEIARQRELPLAVRGGGHGVAGFGTCDGGLVLDLERMRAIDVDSDRRVARAGGGSRWADLDAATHRHGLGTTGGLVSTTGVAGLTLGGGIGWLMRAHGLACDNLVEATVVDAMGQVRVASPEGDSELLWGLRGGGGNFGVVTGLTFRLHPVSDVTAGWLAFDARRADEVIAAYLDLVARSPDELTTMLGFQLAPDDPLVQPTLRGRPAILLVACHVGAPEVAATMVAALDRLHPGGGRFERQAYPVFQRIFDSDMAPGRRSYLKGGFVDGLSNGVVAAITEWTANAPSAGCELDVHQMGGAVSRIGPDDTAFADRRAPFLFNAIARWDDPAHDGVHRDWARGLASALAPFGTGRAYVNFIADREPVDSVRDMYGTPRFQRLRRLKAAYDPDNVFRLNHNVPPDQGAEPDSGRG